MNRVTFALAAASSLALAACGGAKTEPAPADTTVAADVTAPQTAETFPAVATNARTTVKYAGTYSQTGADGKTSTIVLGPNDTWTMTDANGTTTKGTYNWYSDNSRILIGDNVYAIGDGVLYRMASKDAPTTGPFTADVTWRRAGM